jgi:hypothetical protein
MNTANIKIGSRLGAGFNNRGRISIEPTCLAQRKLRKAILRRVNRGLSPVTLKI